MTRFYDAKSDYELATIEDVLDRGGVEYSVRMDESERHVREICVAEEDVATAEELLYLSAPRRFCTLQQI